MEQSGEGEASENYELFVGDRSRFKTYRFPKAESTTIIGFMFASLDMIAKGSENPFENTVHDTPMSALSTTIEADLKQLLNAAQPDGAGLGVPEPVQPVNGFLC